jgi:hypothetical protein
MNVYFVPVCVCHLLTTYRISNRMTIRKFAKQNGLGASFDTKNVTFTVVDSEQANAFVLPGNHVFGTYPQRIISVVIR